MKFFSRKVRLFCWGVGALLLTWLLYYNCNGFYDPHFRTTNDQISVSETVNLSGLKELHASGSRRPRLDLLKERLQHVKQPIVVCSLIHNYYVPKNGYGYIDGIPSEFMSYNREISLTKDAYRYPRHLLRRLYHTGSFSKRFDLLKEAEEATKEYGLEYVNIEIGSKYPTPDESVDEFVAYFENMPEDKWIHFHCLKGMGRTSTALAMYDILRNAPQVSFKDIMARQKAMGSVDLLDTSVWSDGSYTKEMLEGRKKFIEDFYTYISQRKAGGTQLWSEWKNQQH